MTNFEITGFNSISIGLLIFDDIWCDINISQSSLLSWNSVKYTNNTDRKPIFLDQISVINVNNGEFLNNKNTNSNNLGGAMQIYNFTQATISESLF